MNQCSGSINGVIYDRTGAMAQCVGTINEPDLINFDLTTTDLTSPGSNDGTAEVNVTQGNGPITYDWTGPNSYSSSGSSSINGLEDGGYTITMTYNNGQCDTTADFTIFDALQLNITSVDPQTTTPADGAVNFTISGGAMPYDTIIDDGQTQTNGPFTGLSAGQYTLIVTFNNGNTVDSTFTVDNVVSVSKESINEFTVYPNPATNVLNIDGEHLISFTIYDLNGRAVVNTDLQQTQAIDISHLESGVYTVNIRSEKGEYVEKLIIQ
ncbi:MAG: T9SS type A sorting domain-containing protein [Flavobacteriaceae bacterium]|nr:T9SS type A sorting domain-containing protein [Flavobacteriaceae bacterium]